MISRDGDGYQVNLVHGKDDYSLIAHEPHVHLAEFVRNAIIRFVESESPDAGRASAPQDPQLTKDLAAHIRRLCHRVNRHEKECQIVIQAMDYLCRQGLQGSILRETAQNAEPRKEPACDCNSHRLARGAHPFFNGQHETCSSPLRTITEGPDPFSKWRDVEESPASAEPRKWKRGPSGHYAEHLSTHIRDPKECPTCQRIEAQMCAEPRKEPAELERVFLCADHGRKDCATCQPSPLRTITEEGMREAAKVCKKRRFASREKCEASIRQQLADNKPRDPRYALDWSLDAYPCGNCGGWHKTRVRSHSTQLNPPEGEKG